MQKIGQKMRKKSKDTMQCIESVIVACHQTRMRMQIQIQASQMKKKTRGMIIHHSITQTD